MKTPARVGFVLAGFGAGLGVVAGIVQTTAGDELSTWTGNKADPVPLGVLTIVLALAAGAALLFARRPRTAPGTRLALLSFVAVAAVVCFTTVGRLWLLPGTLLLTGAGLAVGHWSGSVATTRQHWPRVLVAALGGCQLLLAAGAAPLLMTVGGLSGLALITAAATSTSNYRATAALMAVGTIPFAALAWTAIAPVLVLILIAALAYPVLGHNSARDLTAESPAHTSSPRVAGD